MARRRRNPVGTAIIGGIAAKKLFTVGAVIAGAYFLSRKKAASPLVVLTPAPIKAGVLVSAESYRVIKDRRSGMEYLQAKGQPGAKIEFTPAKDGIFTRNTVFEGGALFAEVK